MARPRKLIDTATGNFTKDEIRQRKEEEESLHEFEKIPLSPPAWLNKEAKQEYRRIAPLLNKLPIAELDLSMVAMYCDLVSDYIAASQQAYKEGRIIEETDSQGNPKTKINEAWRLKESAAKSIRSIAGQLGMTIDSRMRIVVPKEEEKADPFAELMNDD